MNIDWKTLPTTGSRIKFFREQANLSQQRLADETGISRNSIALYESNQRNPPIKQLKTIAFYLDVSALHLNPEFDDEVENVQEQKFSAQNEYYAVGTLEKLLLTKFRQLTEDQQLKTILFIERGMAANQDIMAQHAGVRESANVYRTVPKTKIDDKTS